MGMSQEILSVGIDIGTTTTQIIFSKLILEDMGSYFSSPNIEITDKEVIYCSPVYITPLITMEIIDIDEIKKILAIEYKRAGITKDMVKTGAVIITGESAKKENAKLVLDKLSSFAGEFVVSTAGADLESVIAGKGSGAYGYSKTNHCRVVNLDIGGGTTNIVLFDDGNLVGQTCVDIGGHLVQIENEKIVYISPTMKRMLKHENIELETGEHVCDMKLYQLATSMASVILECVGVNCNLTYDYKEFFTKGSSRVSINNIQYKLFFSGGVADLIRNNDICYPYNDIGALLGKALYHQLLNKGIDYMPTDETIRATVIGAGMHTTQISGSTITCTCKNMPIMNVPVFHIEQEKLEDLSTYCEEISGQLDYFLKQHDTIQCAIGFRGIKVPSFQVLNNLALNLKQIYDCANYKEQIMIVTYYDCAKALGQILDYLFEYQREILCIDTIVVSEGDYIDFGEPLMDERVIPVVVKTLLFL